MREFNFPSNHRWTLFAHTNRPEWGSENPIQAMLTLDAVKIAFETVFGGQLINSKAIYVLHTDEEYPSSSIDRSIIFIEAEEPVWELLVFQFAHKLCHAIIGQGTPNQLNWFEETLCMLASFYFLELLADTSSIPTTCITLRNYGPILKQCRKNNSARIPSDFTEPFSEYMANHYASLCDDYKNDKLNREMHTLCANKMLPLFFKEPSLWLDVIKISKSLPNDSFKHFLGKLVDSSINGSGANALFNQFFD